MRLNRKILLFTIGILAALLLVSSMVSVLNFRTNYTDALITGTFGIGHSIESLLNELLMLGLPLESLSGMDKKLAEVVDMNEHIAYATVIDPNGKVVFHSQPDLVGRLFTDEVSHNSLKSDGPIWQPYDRFDGKHYFDVAIPLFDGSQRIGVVRLGFPSSVIEDKVMEAVRQLLVNKLLTFIFIAVVLNLLLRREIIEPIKKLSNYAESIADGEYGRKIELDRKDEIGRLSESIERMSERLEEQIEALKRSGFELEEKVDERTQQLAQTNQTLLDSNENLKQTLDRERDLTVALSKSEERFRMLFEHNKAVMLVIDPKDGSIIGANKAAENYYGFAREDMLQKNIGDVNTLSKEEIEHEMDMAREEKRSHFYFQHTLASGEVRDMEVHSGPIDWNGRQVLYSIIHDVTDRKKAEAELDRIAHYDALTGLPNRLLKTDRLRQAMVRSRRTGFSVAVCYLDLDGFKPINDTYGHDVGDLILVEIARRLQLTVREGDTVSRIGGDEFILILSELSGIEQCKQILDRVLCKVSAPISIQGGEAEVEVFASIGLTLFPEDDADADILMRHADQAMYIAKELGKNRYHLFDPVEDRQVKAHREIVQLLEQAVANNQFILHYQPKVNMSTCEVMGMEALIRWNHPEKGLLYPNDFLQYLINTDLEVEVGNWVIESALKQQMLMREMGVDLSVSVNIGAYHLQKPGFVKHIQELMASHPEIKPGDIEFEILETASIDDVNQIYHTLVSCRELGIRFALDDFGTGYSSLAYFHRLPVDLLKIDQTFVRDMLEDPQDLTIVDSVVRLAGAFDQPVIAEGVESLEHGAALLRLGCHLGQGYGIARPMPAEQMPDWLEGWKENVEWQGLKSRLYDIDGADIHAAITSHRDWVGNLIEALQLDCSIPPAQLDSKHCAFGRWFHGVGYVQYGHLTVYNEIRKIHEEIHALGHEMVGLFSQGHRDLALSRVPELELMRDRFVGKLETLYNTLELMGQSDVRAVGESH
ncbi:MAG: EAL domain-containing protein [Candidatus Thiodiazotropha sp. (ex Gloverina cf. vestifex)]|nr:EAL domain-containing protein [Candidatus Thiodiazotropha sp. (ex Gloverina cf. vestifex)]